MTNRPLKSFVTLAAVLALAPAAASAAPASSRSGGFASTEPSLGAPVGVMDWSGLLSLEFPPSGMDVGPRLSGEGMYSVMDLAPGTRLKLGGRTAFAYHSTDFDGTFWVIDAVPDAKITFAATELLALYADVGLGLGIMRFSNDFGSDTSVHFTFQIGGGVAYALNPHVNLLGEVRLDLYTKSGSSTFVSFPTVGLQFH